MTADGEPPPLRLSATASTRHGMLALFWPAHLSAEIDDRLLETPDETLAELQAAGQLLWFDIDEVGASPGASRLSGEFTVGMFINHAVPPELQSFCDLEGKQEQLQVTGLTWLGGIENLTSDTAALMSLSSRKCSRLEIPEGSYSAEVFRTAIPDEVYEHWLRDQAGESAQRWWWVQTWFAATGVVAAMVLVAAMFIATREFMTGAAIVAGVLLAIASLMSLTPGYQRIQQARREYAAAYPSFVICLRTIES